MENSTSRAEVIKPVLLKAGIPLAISVAGIVYAKIISRKSVENHKSSSLETQVSSLETNAHEDFSDEQSFDSLSSKNSSLIENKEQIGTSTHFLNFTASSENQPNCSSEEEILGLRNLFEELQKREWELEMQFIRYRDFKEQESVLLELKNMLLLEIANLEVLDREISWAEAENKRLEHQMVVYNRVLGQIDIWKSENRLLQRKVKKLSRKTIEKSRIIREKNLQIEAREAEILRNCDAIDRRDSIIKALEGEVKERKSVADHLQDQTNELLEKLNLAEKSASKIVDEEISIEAHKQLVDEYEQLRKDRAAEVKELIYLRWSNACLRHELARNLEQQEHIIEAKNDFPEQDFQARVKNGDYVLEHGECSLGVTTSDHACSKRQKLFQKLKRWVEGSEKEKHDIKCFGRHSVSEEAEEAETSLQIRRFCPSA